MGILFFSIFGIFRDFFHINFVGFFFLKKFFKTRTSKNGCIKTNKKYNNNQQKNRNFKSPTNEFDRHVTEILHDECDEQNERDDSKNL